jgi:renalase
MTASDSPTSGKTTFSSDTLVVGAGLAGLALARELAQAGRQVMVLDKSRGVSGRSSTRLSGAAHLDHGARFFTVRNPRTQAWVNSALEAGWLAEWTRSVPGWEAGTITGERGGGHPRYVPPGGMNMIGKELARGLKVQTQTQVVYLRRQDGLWQVGTQDGRVFTALQLVLNLPAPQIAPLLAGTSVDPAPFQAVQFDPCWAVGALLQADLEADWPALRLKNHPALDWVAREHTKRPPGEPPSLMLHARADWSREHLQDAPEAVIAALLDAAREVVGPFEPGESFAQRWLYATPTVRYEQPYGWRPEHALGWCGDWCSPDPHGPRVEAALLSGWGLADVLAAQI